MESSLLGAPGEVSELTAVELENLYPHLTPVPRRSRVRPLSTNPKKPGEPNMRLRLALCGVVVCLCLVPMLSAQDAVKTDPKHYSVISENDQVRILKVHYGP